MDALLRLMKNVRDYVGLAGPIVFIVGYELRRGDVNSLLNACTVLHIHSVEIQLLLLLSEL